MPRLRSCGHLMFFLGDWLMGLISFLFFLFIILHLLLLLLEVLHGSFMTYHIDGIRRSHTYARMTPEYADKSNEELTSAFIVGTCQLSPSSSFVYSDHMHSMPPAESHESDAYCILCGSSAEFYIRPIITCIGDFDNLIANIGELVFDGDFPVFPGDMSGFPDKVTCYKIEPYDKYPGFVRLRTWGEMTFNWKYNKYELTHAANANGNVLLDLRIAASQYYLERKIGTLPNVICGPAIKQQSEEHWYNGADFVPSVWCPQWPKEAQVWLSRPRSNGWPTIDTIVEVMQNGCHVVYVQHRACRNDKHQWRFSFSLAEVTLLMSWTPKQQIVYHLLRFLAKKEIIEKNCPKEDEVLCTYHLKTLMLWTCEEMSPEWWKSSSVIAICCELLKMLTLWLEKRHLPNYFIPEANLFQDQTSSEALEKTIRCINQFCNSENLCHWFEKNYILDYIRRHFQPNENRKHFLDHMLTLFEVWNACQFKSIEFYFLKTFLHSEECCSLMKLRLNHGVRYSFQMAYTYSSLQLKACIGLDDRPTIQNVSCLRFHDNLVYILRIAYGLECGEISWESSLFVETVNTILSQPQIIRSKYHNFPKTCKSFVSRFRFLCAQDFMKNLTGSNSRSEFQLLSLVTKGFLRKTLTDDGIISNGTIPAALSYLAALHFASSEYQEATHLCSAVLVNQITKEDTETLNAGCLLFIDDVARIIGLCVVQKKITESNLHCINRRLYLDLRLSPDVVAQHISELSAERISKQSDFYHDLPDSLYPMDVNLKALIKPKCIFSMTSGSHGNAARQIVYHRTDSLTEIDASRLNHSIVKERVLGVLMEYASDNITLFYNAIRKDFGYDCNTGDCYRALYLYKCRKYDQVLHLCEQILQAPSVDSDLQNQLKEYAFTNILLWPPLDSFFDREVQSLRGFHTLVYYLSPLNDDMGKDELRHGSSFEHWFARNVYNYKLQLSIEQLNIYPIKSQYFLGRHFLARYLKLRCFIDCNLSFEEVLTEFASQKTDLPFEHIIRKFLLQKLHFTKQNSTASSIHRRVSLFK